MDIDYFFFAQQRENSTAWNLLCANRAPVILAFTHEAFIKRGRTSAPESELIEILRDIIFKLGGRNSRLAKGADSFDESELYLDDFHENEDEGDFVEPAYIARAKELAVQNVLNNRFVKAAIKDQAAASALEAEIAEALATAAKDETAKQLSQKKKVAKDSKKGSKSSVARKKDSLVMKDDPIYYLREWSSEESRYFRCSYMGATGEEPIYDITPELQKAYSFIVGMQEQNKNFVPTESRFKELLHILKEVQMNAEGNTQYILDDLIKQRDALDQEIEKVKRGDVELLSPTQIRERFIQFQRNAIDLVDDFRQVEYNLGNLDKEIMQDILNWTGPRGELLDKYFAQNAYIENTDQGRSVKAFSRMLLSSAAQDEIIDQIQTMLNLKEVADLQKDERIYSIHDQWLGLRQNIERVMGASTKRIKSFLQPANLDANRSLKERIKSITDKISDITEREGVQSLPKELIEVEVPRADTNLPFDRPLASITERLEFSTESLQDSFTVVDDKLFDQIVVDPLELYNNIESFMAEHDTISLSDVVKKYPLKHGIAELTTYVKLAMFNYEVVEDEEKEDCFRWEAIDMDGNRVARVATLKHITISRK